ncbi:hypothetical protein [Gloeobacter morelensis]|uniref:Glycosyltransferase n=1 Tax=Gloeobacter morelensis MG652769 TaxID=2781736 RepID=A0ABY3PK22_9CYAN|nr:hypothetical protein [Gloeobacter morelensis]UFP94021.1 hypothetical protein ISF26_20000 [Gloeobacter morelensis MG652769]
MPDLTPRTIVQLVALDETGDSYYRMRWPAVQLAAQAPHWRVINLDATASERYVWAEMADLLVLIQCADPDMLPVIEQRRAQGRQTLVEYNDNYYDPPAWSPAADPWASPLLQQMYERFMVHGDALAVTGPGLERLFRSKTTKPIHILKNHFPEEPPPFEALQQAKGNQIRLGWAGSLGHMADLLAVMPTLKKLLERFAEIKLCLMGNEAIPSLIHVPAAQLEFRKWGTIHDYYAFVKTLHIGIAPLQDTGYNRCRSDVKAVELAALGAVPVLQNTLPYRDFLSETGLVGFSSLDGLFERLVGYLLNPAGLEADARGAHRYVQAWRLASQRRERYELYATMLAATPSKYFWPQGAGYHEVCGTPEPGTPSQKLLQHGRNLWQHGAHPTALQVLGGAVQANPFHPDLALAELRFMHLAGFADIPARLSAYAERFAEDARFALFALAIQKNPHRRAGAWSDLAGRVAGLPRSAADFYFEQISKLFLKDLRADPVLFLEAGECWLRVYPGRAALRLEVAQAAEQCGRFAQAQDHYRWLQGALALYTDNQAFLGGVSPKTVAAWSAALHGRLHGDWSPAGEDV